MASILVVDDAAFMRLRLRTALTPEGFTVEEASNGREAVQTYARSRPDLVLMDITMPILDGIGALKEIRSLNPAATVVICSALGQQSMVMEAMRAGACDFIVKPFQPEKVVEAVRRLLPT